MFSTFSWPPRLLLRSLCCWGSPPCAGLVGLSLWHQGFLLMFELQRFIHDVPHHDSLWFYPIWGSLRALNLSITSFTKFGKALTIISPNTVCLALTFLLLQDSSCSVTFPSKTPMTQSPKIPSIFSLPSSNLIFPIDLSSTLQTFFQSSLICNDVLLVNLLLQVLCSSVLHFPFGHFHILYFLIVIFCTFICCECITLSTPHMALILL